ncbi:MAG: hypothetical protein KGZ25_07680 [Planctomycetes bacterium]|nr:hypothetical protein [Planctomycetota bacterium]
MTRSVMGQREIERGSLKPKGRTRLCSFPVALKWDGQRLSGEKLRQKADGAAREVCNLHSDIWAFAWPVRLDASEQYVQLEARGRFFSPCSRTAFARQIEHAFARGRGAEAKTIEMPGGSLGAKGRAGICESCGKEMCPAKSSAGYTTAARARALAKDLMDRAVRCDACGARFCVECAMNTGVERHSHNYTCPICGADVSPTLF